MLFVFSSLSRRASVETFLTASVNTQLITNKHVSMVTEVTWLQPIEISNFTTEALMFSASTLKRVLISAACLLLPQAVYAKSLVDANNKAAFVELQTSSKQPFTAYVVGPKQAKQAILLIHGWWGLNRQVVA